MENHEFAKKTAKNKQETNRTRKGGEGRRKRNGSVLHQRNAPRKNRHYWYRKGEKESLKQKGNKLKAKSPDPDAQNRTKARINSPI